MAFDLPHPGQLRHSIRIERATAAANIGGVTRQSWDAPTVLIANLRAKIEPTRGGDQIIAGRLGGNVAYDLWIYSNAQTRQILESDRAVNNRTGEIYKLSPALNPDNRGRWLLFQATSSGVRSASAP